MEGADQKAQERMRWWLRLAVAIAIGYLILTVFSPFLSAIAWAAILSYSLYPLYRRLLHATKGRKALSALVMCIAVTLGIILPIFYLSFSIADDLTKTFRAVSVQVQKGEGLFREAWHDYPIVAAVVERFQEIERITGTNIRAALAQNLTELGRALVFKLTNVAKNVLLAVIQLGITLICCFYFFRDGESLVQWLREIIPLPITRDHVVVQRFREVVKGSIYGNTLVAVLEGIIGGLGLWIVGLPSPVLWGAVMGLLAYLPVVGASLVWIPAALYLYTLGAYGKMVALCITGVVIGIVDYFVRPICVGRVSKIHALLVLFSVLGGIKLFGLIGIIAGPLIVAIGVTLLETYRLNDAPPLLTKSQS